MLKGCAEPVSPARDYDGFSEEARVEDLTLTDLYEQYWPGIQASENLGRLKTTTEPPMGKFVNSDGEEVYGLIYAYGARSFSIWSDRGMQIYDSKNDIEEIIATEVPDFFNTTNDENEFDNRSQIDMP